MASAAAFFPRRLQVPFSFADCYDGLQIQRVCFPRSQVNRKALSTSCRRIKVRDRQCFATSAENDALAEDLPQAVQVDLNLPRRRLMAEFTCNQCATRTTRLINPHAYKRGTVYVQCSGCEVYHQLVDNLGIVVEYRFDTESDEAIEES